MTETPDPLAGSWHVESLTNELEAAAWSYLEEIEAMGGTLVAIERGFQQREIQWSAYRVQQAVEAGDHGRRRREPIPRRGDRNAADPANRRRGGASSRSSAWRQVRAERDDAAANRVEALEATAAGDGNLIPAIIEAVRARATVERSATASAWRGRAPRADHRLTVRGDAGGAVDRPLAAGPNGIRQRRCQRSVPLSAMTSIARDPLVGGGQARTLRPSRASTLGAEPEREVRDDLVVRALVRRMIRERRGEQLGQCHERFGGLGRKPDHAREPPSPLGSQRRTVAERRASVGRAAAVRPVSTRRSAGMDRAG